MLSVGGLFVFIIYLIVVAILVGLAQYIVRAVPIADPLGRIINIAAVVIGILIVVLLLLQMAGVPIGLPGTR
jgi:hypothetical protein